MLLRSTGLHVVLFLACALLSTPLASAEAVSIAVASNFAEPARVIAGRFEAATGTEVRISSGSTGKLYAQILAGAPYEVFLAADEVRPQRLVSGEYASEQKVYAVGRLTLVSADPSLTGMDCLDALRDDENATLAIANPVTAPYGRAAAEWLATLDMAPRIVRGDNVAQAMHFVTSRSARFGVVAEAQLLLPAWETRVWPGCIKALPVDSHAPVRQAVALLKTADEAATLFFAFLSLPETRELIASFGYAVDAAE